MHLTAPVLLIQLQYSILNRDQQEEPFPALLMWKERKGTNLPQSKVSLAVPSPMSDQLI